jgi:hypothetical protein
MSAGLICIFRNSREHEKTERGFTLSVISRFDLIDHDLVVGLLLLSLALPQAAGLM